MNHDQDQGTDRDGRRERTLAHEWRIATQFRDPSDYGIPALPDWASGRDATGGMALAADIADEPFISAENPVKAER